MSLKVTESAAKEVKNIMAENGMDAATTYLRLGVRGGGCSGFEYTLDLTPDINESDETFEIEGVKIACDPKSYLYLEGTIVDFKDGIMGRGFAFDNPGATGSCGCGKSFST